MPIYFGLYIRLPAAIVELKPCFYPTLAMSEIDPATVKAYLETDSQHRDAVARELDVGLDAVDGVRECSVECGARVLRRLAVRAAMGVDQGLIAMIHNLALPSQDGTP